MKTKIDVLEPICNASGVFYYAGFVNGVYVHFLGYDRLSTKKIKIKLEEKYYNNAVVVMERG